MLRPACLPSRPDWLRQDAAICPAPRLLRSFVTPAFGTVRRRAALGVRLEGRTGNLPSSGLAPDQFTAASEAAHGTDKRPRRGRPQAGEDAIRGLWALENTRQRIACLGCRNQGALRHRVGVARLADDAPRRDRRTASGGQPGKSKASVSPLAGGGRAGLASGSAVGRPTWARIRCTTGGC